MNPAWIRTLRTAASERFVARRDGRDVAAIDLHHLADGTVAGTVVLFREAGWQEADIPALLSAFDDDYLPGVDLDHGNLQFTVVLADILGNWEAEMPAST